MGSDLEVVSRCLEGENAAWVELLQAHTRKVFNLCYRFIGQSAEAEDLTQEIFIKIFQTLRTFDARQGTFTTWLNRVARNHLVDHYRRTRRDRVTSSLDDEAAGVESRPSPAPSPSTGLEHRERREWLQQGLNRLSPDLREAVILRDLHDLDYDEIAQVLGVPQGTVKSRINRGRLELARVLKRMQGVRGHPGGGGES